MQWWEFHEILICLVAQLTKEKWGEGRRERVNTGGRFSCSVSNGSTGIWFGILIDFVCFNWTNLFTLQALHFHKLQLIWSPFLVLRISFQFSSCGVADYSRTKDHVDLHMDPPKSLKFKMSKFTTCYKTCWQFQKFFLGIY